MAIPDYQSTFLPLLRLAGDEKEHSLREAINDLAVKFALTDEERAEMLPSGKQTTFANRVGWARTYMQKAGLLDKPRKGFLRITERGRKVLASNPEYINVKFLEQFEDFVEFRNLRHEKEDSSSAIVPAVTMLPLVETPEEALESAYQALREELSAEILRAMKEQTPEFFERLVVDLLVEMGYGGSRKEAGRAVGKSGDGGIDGIIKEDRLGLDIIYVQAKRWEGTVGRPEIQKFAGALQGFRARKGIFITTSNFTKDALEYVGNIDTKIILIDGPQLAEFMIEHNVGVTPVSNYSVKRLDTDYFSED